MIIFHGINAIEVLYLSNFVLFDLLSVCEEGAIYLFNSYRNFELTPFHTLTHPHLISSYNYHFVVFIFSISSFYGICLLTGLKGGFLSEELKMKCRKSGKKFGLFNPVSKVTSDAAITWCMALRETLALFHVLNVFYPMLI